MTLTQIAALARGIAPVLRDYWAGLAERVSATEATQRSLEARVAALEAKEPAVLTSAAPLTAGTNGTGETHAATR